MIASNLSQLAIVLLLAFVLIAVAILVLCPRQLLLQPQPSKYRFLRRSTQFAKPKRLRYASQLTGLMKIVEITQLMLPKIPPSEIIDKIARAIASTQTKILSIQCSHAFQLNEIAERVIENFA